MIRKLQLKITAIMTGVLLIVFVVVLVTQNFLMQRLTYNKTETTLWIVTEFDGAVLSPDFSPDDDMAELADDIQSNYVMLYAKLDHQGKILEYNTDKIYNMTSESLQELVSDVLAQGSTSGTSGRYQYVVQEKEYGKLVVCAERGHTLEMFSDLVTTSAITAGISCLLLLGISFFLARWAVKPVKETFDKQRRFISDAGHELKTPLTIIMANTDVLTGEIGDNTELSHIRDQSGRMNHLIHDMLSLSKAEEESTPVQAIEFDLSNAVLNTVLGFESAAFEADKKMTYEIQGSIRFTGDEGQIRQVVSIFVDNAIKHSEKNGEIRIELKRDGGKIRISFYNTGVGVKESEREKIFERFYRSDESRSRETGGYGLGLAIAKSIVDQHGGKITVAGKAGEWVRFTVKL